MSESAGTLHGQLQRGLGRAARRAAGKPGAGEYVYDCVRRDPRWDWQCESRSLYYARLMVDLELPVGPLAEHLFDPADHADEDDRRVGLTLRVLAEMVRLSRREAAAVLRDYAEDGMHWYDALNALVDAGDPALTAGLDELVVARCDEPALESLVAGPRNPVIESWAARQPQIAAAVRRQRTRPPMRRPASQATDRSAFTDAELLRLARGGDDAALSALFELGRRRAPALLELADELLPQQPGRWRSALFRPLTDFGPAALPYARVWATTDDGRAPMGMHILAAHGTRQDIPILMKELTETMEEGYWRGAADPIEGLGRLRAGEAVPLLKTAWTETPYAHLRPRVLTALIRTAPHTAEAYAVEGLWDCQSGAREIAAGSAPLTDDTRIRLQRLEHDAAEEPEVRAAAAARAI
ncbi:hypothetical protein [Actinomadura macrotermitis]|uniref:HEAT repeat domain-containing protein n=1 Tax=Actinomadura macrotermitis TaxID=2585200 RepID=A0A7K0BM74_9ACTN|nr:hypothetical protein [Actinomadura macrotermitis]MQY02277.1 hypothetical protein [Actinomadura macrotermitis]